jgi:hypothetical protein
MLSNGTYPSPFSLDSSYGARFPKYGFDLPTNPKIAEIIKQISRTKFGRDINIVNQDIRHRSDLDAPKEEPKPNLPGGFPSF